MRPPVGYRASDGVLLETPLSAAPLAPDALWVEHLAISVEAAPGILGRVREVGAELAGEAARWIDHLVALPGLRSCGACLPCRRGHPASCAERATTPWASHGAISARLAVPLDGSDAVAAGLQLPDPPALVAALAGVGLVAYAAVVRAGVEPNRAAIVLGRGSLPSWICAWVRHRGAEPIRADDRGDAGRIAETLAARGIEPFGLPVIDAGGGAALACALAPIGGAVVLCGAPGDEPIAGTVVDRGLTVHGFAGAHPDLLPEVCAFVRATRFELAPLCRVVDRDEAGRLASGGPATDERTAIWSC